METEVKIMPGYQKCTRELTSQLTEYEDYFQFGVYVFKTMPFYFKLLFHYHQPS